MTDDDHCTLPQGNRKCQKVNNEHNENNENEIAQKVPESLENDARGGA